MANLRVDKITSTETFETTGSVNFDGVGDFIQVTESNNAFDFDGDFTVEFWYYLHKDGVNTDFLGTANNAAHVGGSKSGWVINYTGNSTGYRFGFSNDGSWDINFELGFQSRFKPATWQHLAVTRKSGTFRYFIDGDLLDSRYDTTNLISTEGFLNIGAGFSNTSNEVQGFLSNVRIIKGKALYTESFKPSMKELEVTPETVTLACQSKTDATLEKTGKTTTASGNVVASELTPGLLTPIPKAGGSSAITGSVEFSGNLDFMTITETEDFDFGTGDFTIEYWYWESNNSKSERRTLDMRDSTRQWMIGHTNDNGGKIFFEAVTGGVTAQVFSENNANTTGDRENWRHLAVVRNGNTLTIYLDGVNRGSGSFTGTIRDDQNTLNIGRDSSATTRNYQGFLSNLRVVKGTALYVDDFIPPTRELKKVPGTVLLCCQDSNNPTQEATGKTISLNGVFDNDDVISSGITTTPVSSNFTPQVGDDRKVTFEGVTKINTENYFYFPTGNTESRTLPTDLASSSNRGVFGGGYLASPVRGSNHIDYITISSKSNSIDFGDLFTGNYNIAAVSSKTRGIWAGGQSDPSNLHNSMQYVTISSTGNADDFGDLNLILQNSTGASNSTRGLWMGGQNPSAPTSPVTVLNNIEMITLQSTGNTREFGDLSGIAQACRSCASPTRALRFGGSTSGASGNRVQTIDYVTISTTGNALAFGDLQAATWFQAACSNSIRGLNFGNNPATDVIDYVTIASLGDSKDFGTLTETFANGCATSSPIRAVVTDGGQATMEYVTISSTGNSKDFGDFVGDGVHNLAAACSDSHGGLG